VQGSKVTLGCDAPREITIHREEIALKIEAGQASALQTECARTFVADLDAELERLFLLGDDELSASTGIMPLQWSENRAPGPACRHDHCEATTPIGVFLITWRGDDDPTVEKAPWGDAGEPYATIDEAKRACEREYFTRIQKCHT
jgi:hypothetical protein